MCNPSEIEIAVHTLLEEDGYFYFMMKKRQNNMLQTQYYTHYSAHVILHLDLIEPIGRTVLFKYYFSENRERLISSRNKYAVDIHRSVSSTHRQLIDLPVRYQSST